MLVWVRAATLPRVMVRTEISMRTAGQAMLPVRSQGPFSGTARPPKKKRVMIAKPAALGATERKAVSGVGEPGGQEVLDPGEARRARHPVEQGEPVEHRPRGDRPEEDVLERGLV